MSIEQEVLDSNSEVSLGELESVSALSESELFPATGDQGPETSNQGRQPSRVTAVSSKKTKLAMSAVQDTMKSLIYQQNLVSLGRAWKVFNESEYFTRGH